MRQYVTIGQKVQVWTNSPGHWQSGDVGEVLENNRVIGAPNSGVRVKWLSGQRIGKSSRIDYKYVNLL